MNETRVILNVDDEEIGELSLPEGTSEEIWEQKLSLYRTPSPKRYYVPSFAVDKNNVDEVIDSPSTATTITAERELWDKDGAFNLSTSKFHPNQDGIFNFNGTIAVTPTAGVTNVALQIFRNNELWFTVASQPVLSTDKIFLVFSCDVDAYQTSQHDFDLRLLYNGSGSVTISGSDEETAWGATFLTDLEGESPT